MSTTISSNNHMHNDSKLFNYMSYLDEDLHADMHCARANFSVIKYSSYQCDVNLFLDSYDTTLGVDVVMATMAIQLSAGDILYLVSTAALWFGDKMETLLLNANITRDVGLELCTDHHDMNSAFGTEIGDYTFPYNNMEISLVSICISPTPMMY